jgi:hypothetical protein
MRRWGQALFAAAALSATALGGCAEFTKLKPTSQTNHGPGPGGYPSFAQFTDIPVPKDAEMNISETVVFGGHDAWSGQLVLDTGHNHSAMFDFYKGEMPKFGWEEITAVRTNQSVMAYTREERVATIQIESVKFGGLAVRMVVAPRNPNGSESAQRLFRTSPVAKDPMPVVPVN